MGFGTALKQAREGLGLTTQDLSLRTKIRGDYLRALEDGNTALLPERTFARSYLQRYARELGLDPAPLLLEFDRSVPAAPEIAQSLRGTAAPGRRRRPLGAAGLAAALTGLIVLGAGGYYAYATFARPAAVAAAPATPAREPAPVPAARTVRLTVSSVPAGARVYLDNRDLGATPVQSFPVEARDQAVLRVELAGRQPLRQTVALQSGRNLRALLAPAGDTAARTSLVDLAARTVAAVPPATPAAPADGAPASPAPAPTTPPAAPAPTSAVSVTFSGASWTRVTDASGRVLYQGTPPSGAVKGFPAGVTIRAGNAGAVRVAVAGGAAQPLGQSGQVVTRTY